MQCAIPENPINGLSKVIWIFFIAHKLNRFIDSRFIFSEYIYITTQILISLSYCSRLFQHVISKLQQMSRCVDGIRIMVLVCILVTRCIQGAVNKVLAIRGIGTHEKDDLSSRLNRLHENERPSSGTRQLSFEMMLGALIKWRLPFPGEKSSLQKKCRSPPPPLRDGWKAFELRYARDTDLGDRHCPRTSYLRTTCNKYRYSFVSFIFAHRLDLCAIYLLF